jgi:hypothetical protein
MSHLGGGEFSWNKRAFNLPPLVLLCGSAIYTKGLPEQAVGWFPLRFGIGSIEDKSTEFSCTIAFSIEGYGNEDKSLYKMSW